MFNDGVLRNNEGGCYSLKDCVVVLTSNLGIEEAEQHQDKKLLMQNEAADQLVNDARKRLGMVNEKRTLRPRQR